MQAQHQMSQVLFRRDSCCYQAIHQSSCKLALGMQWKRLLSSKPASSICVEKRMRFDKGDLHGLLRAAKIERQVTSKNIVPSPAAAEHSRCIHLDEQASPQRAVPPGCQEQVQKALQ